MMTNALNTQPEDFDVEKTRQELELVSKVLVGETVLLYVRPPIVETFLGHAYRDSKGVRSIDIHPKTVQGGIDYFYQIFLHECGHHVLGDIPEYVNRPAKVERRYLKDGAYLKPSKKSQREYDTNPRELAAKSFQEQIDRLARDKALAMFGNDEITTRIRVLKDFFIFKKENKNVGQKNSNHRNSIG